MRTRYKTFQEFIAQIRIVKRNSGGILITCNLKRYKVVESRCPLWNSDNTQHSFLVRCYIDEILRKKCLSEKIQRMTGVELIGKRFTYKRETCIVVNTYPVVDKNSGELETAIVVMSITNSFRYDPFKLLKSEIQL